MSWSLVAGRRCGRSRPRHRSRSTASARPSPGRSPTRRRSRASRGWACEESGIGDPESRIGKRFKVMGILRDVLRQRSVGVIEDLPEKGIVKYAKPAGLIASLVPTTNPELTPPGVALFAIKCRDAVIFSPHPRSQRTTQESRRDHAARARARGRPGRPAAVPGTAEHPGSPVPDDPGGPRPGDGRPGHGQGGVQLRHARLRCRCGQLDDGHRRDCGHRRGRQEHASRARHPTSVPAARRTGTWSSKPRSTRPSARSWSRKAATLRVRKRPSCSGSRCGMTRGTGRRTRSRSPRRRWRARAGFEVPADRRFFIVEQTEIGKHNVFSSEKLGVVVVDVPVLGVRERARDGHGHLRGRGQGPLLRDLFLRRRSTSTGWRRWRR